MYCSTPFRRFHINIEGDVNLCFGHTWTSKGVGNILREEPMAIWHGAAAAEFRQTILDGSFRYCTNCRCPELLDLKDSPSALDLSYIDVLALAYDYRCNIWCPSCRDRRVKSSPLAADIHRRVLETDLLLFVRTISCNGSGEPLASPYFWDLIAKLPSKDCHPELGLVLCTNAQLLTGARLDEIKSAGKPVRGIEVSVDAACEDTYKFNRRGGSWSRLLENLTYLATTGIPLRLNFVVQANNFEEMPRFVELADRFGASYVRFDALTDWGAFHPDEHALRAVHVPTHPQHEQLLQVLQHENLKDPRVHMAKLSGDYFATLDPLQTIRLLRDKDKKP
jgi:molybdenum cofactor biosynthesis enzyme MoaA